jgi:hypothetical protein
MDYDWDNVDEAVLALLSLGLHDGCRAWKGFDAISSSCSLSLK